LFDSDFEPPHESGHFLTHDVYCNVIRQVNAIAQPVSLGKDHKAQKFLHELIAAQFARGDETDAVKSLLINWKHPSRLMVVSTAWAAP